jgi:hypothetical protein
VTRQQSLEPRDAPFLERCGQRSFDRRFIHAVYTLIIGISAHPILLRYAVHERIRPLSWTSVSPAPGPACGFSATPSLLAQLTLDGTFTDRELSPAARLAQIAEQTVRDILVDRPDIRLTDVNVLQMPVGPVVVVSIQSAREPIPPRIGRAEKTIPERTGDPNVVLLVRTVVSSDITSTGRVLLGQAHFGVSSVPPSPGSCGGHRGTGTARRIAPAVPLRYEIRGSLYGAKFSGDGLPSARLRRNIRRGVRARRLQDRWLLGCGRQPALIY